MRERAGNYVPPVTGPTAALLSDSRTPASIPVLIQSGQLRTVLHSKTVLAGVIVTILSCVFFVITSAGGANTGIPAFFMFCLLPMGLISLLVGFVRFRRDMLKGGQNRSGPPSR